MPRAGNIVGLISAAFSSPVYVPLAPRERRGRSAGSFSEQQEPSNIAKTMTSNGKQFTVSRKMLTAVARDQMWADVVAEISARFSKFAFVLFRYITNHFMTGPLWNSEFCFPLISMFPSTSSRETKFTVPLGTSN